MGERIPSARGHVFRVDMEGDRGEVTTELAGEAGKSRTRDSRTTRENSITHDKAVQVDSTREDKGLGKGEAGRSRTERCRAEQSRAGHGLLRRPGSYRC